MGFKATAMGSVLGAGLLLYVAGNATIPAIDIDMDASGLFDSFRANPAMTEIEVGMAGEELKRSQLDTKEREIEVTEKLLESQLRTMKLEQALTKSQIDLATQRALSQETVKQQVERELLDRWVWGMIELAWLVIIVLILPIVVILFFIVKTVAAYRRYLAA